MEKQLYSWQKEALREWELNNYSGVIEAVTGSGKTLIALEIIKKHLREKWKIVVLVPSLTLQEQWGSEIRKYLKPHYPCVKVDRFKGRITDLDSNDIIIALPQRASKNYLINTNANNKYLLIADECHRYGSKIWSLSLEEEFQRRLGITATLERNDDGVSKFLLPYFDRVVFNLDYERALQENSISEFNVGFLEVEFNSRELDYYNDLNKDLSKLRKSLVNIYKVRTEPFGTFLEDLKSLAGDPINYRGKICARQYLSLFSERRRLLSSANSKFSQLRKIAPVVKNSKRTILFAQTIEAAQLATRVFNSENIKAASLHSGMDSAERADVFFNFENGENELIAAPLLLDEGVNVPSADLAIILSSSRTKRQMIQRMGRVLRKDPDYPDKLAKILILFVKDTAEDPRNEFHDDFFYLIENAANDITIFEEDTDVEDIFDFFNIYDHNNKINSTYDIEDLIEFLLKEIRDKKTEDLNVRKSKSAIADKSDFEKLYELTQVIRNGDLEQVAYLIDSGIDINIKFRNNSTALFAAIEYGQDDIAEWLLDNGADVDLQNNDGYTPLLYSIDKDSEFIPMVILSMTDDVNCMNDDGETPLLLAYEKKNLGNFELLLTYGPDVDIKYKDGQTILMKAIRDSEYEYIEKIFGWVDPDLNITDDNEKTVYEYARESGNQQIIEIVSRYYEK